MKKTGKISVRVEPELQERLEDAAANRRVAVGWLVREFILEGLERPPGEGKTRRGKTRRRGE